METTTAETKKVNFSWLIRFLLIRKPNIITFLEEADEAYIIAFKTKDVSTFSLYAESRLTRQIKEKVLSGSEIHFGIKRYRKREWTLIEEKDNKLIYDKLLTHDSVEFIHNICFPLGDSLHEIWEIDIKDNKYKVSSIRRSRC